MLFHHLIYHDPLSPGRFLLPRFPLPSTRSVSKSYYPTSNSQVCQTNDLAIWQVGYEELDLPWCYFLQFSLSHIACGFRVFHFPQRHINRFFFFIRISHRIPNQAQLPTHFHSITLILSNSMNVHHTISKTPSFPWDVVLLSFRTALDTQIEITAFVLACGSPVLCHRADGVVGWFGGLEGWE